MAFSEASILRVEGKDDEHVVWHLLLRHGIDCEHIPVAIKSPDSSGHQIASGIDALLEGMPTEVRSGTGRSVGFVLDADEDAGDRWNAVRDRLKGVGLTLPHRIPQEGFVGEASTFQARVGVWLMPDNQRSGALEEFLQDLVHSNDPLMPIAERSTHEAKEQGARFPDTAQLRAALHAWLAWQERPGVPYGTAIRARYFSDDSAAAIAFVEWFKRVFL